MWFLMRSAFWFSMVLVLLPIFDRDASDRLSHESGVELTDAFGAATGAISYMSAICSEKPDVCVKGAETFTALGSRAREGARVAYTYLDTKFQDEEKQAASDAVTTGSVTPSKVESHIPIPVPRPEN